MRRSIDTRKLGGSWTLILLLLVGALYAAHKGQDAAWDLKNYHLYNAWAFLHGRLSIDLAPVGLQGFFNPLLDVPYFWLGVGPLHHWPRLLAAVQGLWYGALAFVLLRVSVRLAEVRGRSYGVPDLLAVVIGITGTMAASQAGTCTNEVPLALLVVLGFYVLLPLCARDLPGHATRRVVVAGLLCGLAAGLKPTAVVFTPAMAVALWLALGARTTAWRLSLIFTIVAFAAFLVAYGWWGLELYKLTGDPVFPMFNQIFHSSWVPATAGTDRQFMPRGLLQWLFYPFYWIHKNHWQGGNTFADARYAAAMIAAAILCALLLLQRSLQDQGSRSERFLLTFMVTGYVLWLLLYSILRYAVSLEVMTGLLIMVTVQRLTVHSLSTSQKPRLVLWSMVAIALLLIGSSRYPDWGHAPFADVTFDVHPGTTVAPGSMVLVIGQPNSYLIPFFNAAQEIKFVGITWLTSEAQQYRLGELTRARVINHRGPLYAILRDVNGEDVAQLSRILPLEHLVQCHRIASAMEQTKRGTDLSDGLRICNVIRY
ncbi:MAG: hypothetical protein EPN49_10825 [Rhodanobacter sp.]|nr:MAG: hypothetical protein EPN49_10825 [Rhodanobacter sp.]